MVQAFKKKRVRERKGGGGSTGSWGGKAIHKQEYMSTSSSYAVEKMSKEP